MRIKFRRGKGFLTANIEGDLDLSSAETFKDKIDNEMKNLDAAFLILNLKHLDFIDSTGLAALLGRHKMLTYGNGKMVLSEVPPKVTSMLEMAGLHTVIPQARDQGDALRLIQKKGEVGLREEQS